MHLLGIGTPYFNMTEYVEYLEKQMTNKDHIERTKHMIEVMQAYVDGESVEGKGYDGYWSKKDTPYWDWDEFDYRVIKTPDTINWDHVAPEFCFMKRNDNDSPFLYTCHPNDSKNRSVYAGHFASYRKGTCDWKDSLVIRPSFE